MTTAHYAPDSATLRNTLVAHGIKEPMWQGFQISCRQVGSHIRRNAAGDAELIIKAAGRGYTWELVVSR